MDQPLERRIRLPGDVSSAVTARRAVRALLHQAGLDTVAPDALLLTSELCEHSVLHAGTGFDLQAVVAGGEVTIAITDRGPNPMELRRAASTRDHGLVLVDTLAAAWGSRLVDVGQQGHVNADAGLGPWPLGEQLLEELRG